MLSASGVLAWIGLLMEVFLTENFPYASRKYLRWFRVIAGDTLALVIIFGTKGVGLVFAVIVAKILGDIPFSHIGMQLIVAFFLFIQG
jgi:hypothetical protein